MARRTIRKQGRMKSMNSNPVALQYVEKEAIPNVGTGTIILHVKDGKILQVEEVKKTPVHQIVDEKQWKDGQCQPEEPNRPDIHYRLEV